MAFIRKVYAILSIQLFFTVVVATIVILVDPISDFMVHKAGIGLYLIIVVLSLIRMFQLSSLILIFLKRFYMGNFEFTISVFKN